MAEAIKIDPKDPDIRLLLATVYQMNDEREKAISELKEALKFAPDHIKILYDLTELYAVSPIRNLSRNAKSSFFSLLKRLPEIWFLNLIYRNLYQERENDKAIEQLEIIHKQFPEFPKEAIDYYNKTLALLKKYDKENAIIQFTIFHNYLKVLHHIRQA